MYVVLEELRKLIRFYMEAYKIFWLVRRVRAFRIHLISFISCLKVNLFNTLSDYSRPFLRYVFVPLGYKEIGVFLGPYSDRQCRMNTRMIFTV